MHCSKTIKSEQTVFTCRHCSHEIIEASRFPGTWYNHRTLVNINAEGGHSSFQKEILFLIILPSFILFFIMHVNILWPLHEFCSVKNSSPEKNLSEIKPCQTSSHWNKKLLDNALPFSKFWKWWVHRNIPTTTLLSGMNSWSKKHKSISWCRISSPFTSLMKMNEFVAWYNAPCVLVQLLTLSTSQAVRGTAFKWSDNVN